MSYRNDEEKKKREEEARNIISSINPQTSIDSSINFINYANDNNYKINVNNSNEQSFINRVNEANNIINSINTRENKPAPKVTEEESQKSRETAQSFIDLVDKNLYEENKDEQKPLNVINDSNNVNNSIDMGKLKNLQKASSKNTVSESVNSSKNVLQNTKIGLANSSDVVNSQEVSTLDIKAIQEAEEKNKNIENGGLSKFEELIDTVLNNIYGGAKQTVSGLTNVITTAVGFGIRGLEGASKIVGLENIGNSLNNAYNQVVDTGSEISETANYERTVTSQVNDDLIKTAGDVTNVISNMVSSQIIGYAIPAGTPGVVIQGLSVGGSSAQEVLDENKDNIGQATLTGIAKGYTSYLTEKMFDANILTRETKKTSLQEAVNRLISNKISSDFGKEVTNRAVGIIGENLEELVEDNTNNLIDKLINNKDLPDFEEWWNNTTETVKTTTLSTIIMNMLGLGGTSFKEIEKNADAQYWIDQAQQIIDQENLAIHFNPSEVKNINQTQDFYITRFTPEGEIANIVPTKGKTINNSKPELNVTPVVVLDSNTKMYNVIDGNTGVVLDRTPYSTTLQAEGGFNDKANNLSDLQIKDINNKISEANYMINNEILSTIEQAQEQLKKMTPIDYKINNKKETSQRQYTKEQYDKITRTVNQISDGSVYNFEEANNAFDIVSNNIKNVNVIEQSGNRYLNSLDKEGYVVYQQKLNKKKYTGKDMKEIINTAISHADTSNIYEEINVNNTQASSESNASNFYTNETNYAVQDIKKVTEAFSKQKSYSKDKLAEIWNNEVSDNNYDAYYDKDGNIERYIAIEEDGDNIVVNQYDDNDNIVKSEVIPSKNGKYSAKAIKDTIEKVSIMYDESRPIKGQRDIEGNEVLSMKKKTTHNTEENNIQEDIENFSNQVDAVLDGSFPKRRMLTILKETPKPLQDIGLPNLPITMTQRHLDTILNETGKDKNANYHNLGVDTIKQLPEAINNPLDIVMSNTKEDSIVLTTYLADKNDNTIIASIKIDGKGLVNNILIDTNVMTSAYGKDNYEAWMDKNLKKGKLLYDIDRGVIKKVDVARFQLPRSTNSRDTGARFQLPGSNISTTNKTGSSITHSIPQTTEVVKSDIAINKQSMQNIENNTQEQKEIQKALHNRIANATLSKNTRKNTYLGRVSDNVAKKVKSLLGIDISNRTHLLMDNDIRHMLKQHGNTEIERARGQIAITNRDIEKIPDILNNYDRIEKGTDNKQGKTIRYIKEYSNNQTYVVEVIPTANDTTLYVKTMWKKAINNKKEAVALTNSKNAPSSTSKTRGNLASKNNIPQNGKNVKDDGVRTMKRNTSRNITSQNNVAVDNQGRTLSKQQQEYFRNSKVRDNNGNLLTVYHGTDKAFTEFKNKYIQHGRAIIDGYYLTPDKANASEYGNNIMELYANIENPLYLHSYNGVTRELIDRGYANNTEELINKYNLETDDSGVVPTAKALTKLVKKLGYDGIITTTQNDDVIDTDWSATQIVVLNSNQIKNIDNVNPTLDKDIRFAKKTAKPKEEILEPGQTNAQRATNYVEQEIRKIEQSGKWDESIPVTRLTDIRKTIEDYLGIGVQKGHFRQQAYGIYKTNRDVIRTKELKDIDTILHETGHALDIGKRINIDKNAISDELLKAVNNYGGYETESKKVKLEEGFAEVIREYTIIPDQTKKEYPQTVSILEEIRQVDKDFDNFIRDVQQQIYNYIHQTPRNRGGLSNMSIGERTDKKKLTPAKIQQEVMRNIYDKDWATKSVVNELQKIQGKTTQDLKASENAYYLTRLASGIGGKITSMLSNGYIDENGIKLMPGLNQLGEILNNDPERFNDLRAYLVAQRDLEYKAKTLKTGIRTMDSKAIVEQFKNDTQIKEASKLIYDTLDGVMQYAVNNGLVSQETANTLKESNVFYVPMQRVLEDNKNNVGSRGAVKDVIKYRTGSELDIKDILENVISNSANIILQVENNNILKALYTQGEQAGITGKIYDVINTPMLKIDTAKLSTWENELRNQGVDISNIDFEKTIDLFAPDKKVDSQNLITSFINDKGKRVYLQFYDDVLFNSLMNMDKKFMSIVLNINRKLNMPLRYGATMANLGFAIPNVISDTVQATIFSEAGFIPIVDNLIGVIDIISAQNKGAREFFNKIIPGYADRINTLYAIYEQSGATSSTRMSQYRETTQVLMEDVYGTKNSEVVGIKEKYKPLKRLLDIMTYIPEISEQSTRLRVFEKNLAYYRRNGLSETDARIKAALQSRDATQDFGRTGNVTREINQLIPFSAARVGSAYTFAENVKANPKKVAIRLSILTAIAMAIKAIGYDNEEIEELNQRKKDDNFVLKIGNEIITIKKPQGILKSIINLVEYTQDLFTGHIEEGKEGERLSEWLRNTLADNTPADNLSGWIPNAIAPMAENYMNKDFYYNSDIVKSYDLSLPDSQQYYDYNSQLAIWLGQIFNYSPAKIDNLISGYFAGLGTSITDMMDYALGKMGITAEQPEMGAEDNGVAKRFIVNVNSNSASVDEIYTLKTELTKKKNGNTITEQETQQLEDITNATSEMAKLNKQIKEIKKDLRKSGEQKAEEIKQLQKQKTDIARKALGKSLLYPENKKSLESIGFYPSGDTLSQNGYTLNLTSSMKKEYEKIAYEKYQQYAKQGLYSEEKLKSLKKKSKDYAKSQLLKKYKNDLIKKNK